MAKAKQEVSEEVKAPEASVVVADVAHVESLLDPSTIEQSVPLDAWVRHKFAAHKANDQSAGFQYWARKQGFVRQTSANWESLFQTFNAKHVG